MLHALYSFAVIFNKSVDSVVRRRSTALCNVHFI